ncbi:lipid A biosynthesis domain-containing protein [uncultured Pseudodesulfovibrio sp.]|uniref:lipid A biosynthesis domain-containing protein n=1 Tax=uncultured Pseudodesulfovibrio sp. TaxID=2035858 RepID=UPI0029C7F296|nr:lipid A biosynthesis domain-containing protein [uncultured Pseudodesulfovibrio sp.]
MTLPDHWWLLALVVVFQGLYFVRIIVLRTLGKGVQPLARSAQAVLAVSGLAGLIYGFVQRDPLFFLGQGCLLVLYYRMQRERNDLG